MKNTLQFYLRLLTFWLFFFICQQVSFLLTSFSSLQAVTIPEILYSFKKGLVLDLATCVYLISLPVLLSIISWFTDWQIVLNKIVKYQTRIFIVVCCFIGSMDSGIFTVWGTKTNAKAISYMAYPDEVLPALFARENIGLFAIMAIQIVLFWWLFNKMYKPLVLSKIDIKLKIITPFVVSFVLVIIARGGFQRVPINRNQIFYSSHSVLNYAALNSFWNFADIFLNPIPPQHNPYVFFDHEKANHLLHEMHQTKPDSVEKIFNTNRPNIIVVMLESWSADVIECLGGEKGITPKFCNLKNEGLFFDKCYATGDRTEQGMLAVLSAYPAQPISSIIKEFGKFDKLPNLYKVMNENNYHTSYYNGGRLQFDNIEAYLRAAGVKTMVGEDDFTINKRTNWGAYDEETFAKHLTDLKQTPQPFFSVLSTMTTHEWFDAAIPQIFKGDIEKLNDGYRNTMHYADSCLYAYIQEAKKQDWYKNTVFVILADHACKFPKGRNIYEVERHHIPMLVCGGALNKEWVGKTNSNVISHTDIAATLLGQMDIANKQFKRSKNILAKQAPHFAYYAFDNGFGLVTDTHQIIYDHNQQKVVYSNKNNDSLVNHWLQYGKAYLQTNYQDNVDYATIKAKVF